MQRLTKLSARTDIALGRSQITETLHSQGIARIGVEVKKRDNDDARAFQELLFCRTNAICVEAEIRPVRKLLIPAHDR